MKVNTDNYRNHQLRFAVRPTMRERAPLHFRGKRYFHSPLVGRKEDQARRAVVGYFLFVPSACEGNER